MNYLSKALTKFVVAFMVLLVLPITSAHAMRGSVLDMASAFTENPDRVSSGASSIPQVVHSSIALSRFPIKRHHNHAPVAADDLSYTVAENGSLSATSVLANDPDADCDPLTAILVTFPSHAASFIFNIDGTFIYVPIANFVGTDSFTYKAYDGTAYSNIATVTIEVTGPPNNAPVANDDPSYSTNIGTLLNGNTVLANDTDADSDPLTASLVSGPSHAASFTLNSNGTFAYTPVAGFTGTDIFVYKANDGKIDSNTAAVTITVNQASVFTIAASGPTTLSPGNTYNYTYQFTTSQTVNNTQFSTTLPGHVTFVTASIPGCSGIGTVTCDLGTVSANGSFTLTVALDKLKKVATTVVHDTYSIGGTGTAISTGPSTIANVITPFADVAAGYWALDYIQSIWAAGITGGCASSPLAYCPGVNITRAEMAVFIERSVHGNSFVPPVVPLTFTDTAGNFAQYWIEALKADGITSGCSPTTFCPGANITRAQMAIFLLRGKFGSAHVPPAPTGSVWLDIPATYWAAGWAEELGTLGISSGCGGGNFCPESTITREQMAILVQRTFGFTLPTP